MAMAKMCEFGPFCISPLTRTLSRDGVEIPLSGREFDTLLALVKRPGVPVSRSALAAEVWPDTEVSDSNLRQQIRALRRKLGRSPDGKWYILTVPNCGYQLAAQVVGSEESTLVDPFVPRAKQETSEVELESALSASGHNALAGRRTAVAASLVLIASVATLATGVGWYLWPREVQLLACRQITRDSLKKAGRLLTDGTRVYFTETLAGRPVIASVPVIGGQVNHIELPSSFADVALAAISPDRHALLLDSRNGLYQIRLRENALQQIPLPRGTLAGQAAWDPLCHRIALGGGDLLTILEPWKAAEPLQLRLPGLVSVSGWNPRDRRLRFQVQDVKSSTARWWDLRDGDRVAHPLRNLSPNWAEGGGSWTSDGRFFVFHAGPRGSGDQSQIWVADGDPPHSYRLTTDALIWRYPTAVPGANTILALARPSLGRLVTLEARGSGALSKPVLPGVSASELDYSRDGNWVAYTLFPEQTVWRSRVDGSEPRQLSPSGMEAHQPHWSPDGTRIAFMGRQAGNGTRWRVYLVPSSGGSLDQPLPEGDDQGVPTWSPDGRVLVFGDLKTTIGFEHATIHELSLQTRTVSAIAAPTGMWTPRMSPDGKHLVAVSYNDRSLYIRDNQRETWRKCVTMDFIEKPIWPLDSSFVQFIGRPRPAVEALYRVSPNCGQPKQIVDLSSFEFPGDRWVGITPDHAPCALWQIPDEIYALDWRLRRLP